MQIRTLEVLRSDRKENIISNWMFDLIVSLCIYMYIKKPVLSVFFNQIRIHKSLCNLEFIRLLLFLAVFFLFLKFDTS